jgi:Lipocalin-like domain
MNTRSMFSMAATAALGVALVPSMATAQEKSLKDQLVGTWTVTSWEQDVANGPKVQRFGADPKGINVFQRNGHFFVMFLNPSIPKIASNNASKPTPEEAVAIVAGSIAYYGTYAVDEASKVITMHIEATTLQNQLGLDQKRTVTSISPTELKYANTNVVGNLGTISVSAKRAN